MAEGRLKYTEDGWVLCEEHIEKLDTLKSIDIKAGECWRKCNIKIMDDCIIVDDEVRLTPELADNLDVILRQYDRRDIGK